MLVRRLGWVFLGIVTFAAPAMAQDEVADEEEAVEEEAEADEPEDRDEPAEGQAPPARAPGTYQGVSPDVKPPEGARAGKLPKRPSLTWIGFQAAKAQGGGRAFVQLSHPVAYDQFVEGGDIVFRFPNVRMAVGNYDRPIDTRFFDTQVASIYAKRVGAKKGLPGGVEVRMKVKDGVTAKSVPARIERGEDGFQYLFIDVPAP